MITLGEKDGMQRLDVRPGKGGGLIAWYTGPEEIKQGKCDLFITDINKLIEPMYSSRDIIGMVINPDTDVAILAASLLVSVVQLSDSIIQLTGKVDADCKHHLTRILLPQNQKCVELPLAACRCPFEISYECLLYGVVFISPRPAFFRFSQIPERIHPIIGS